MMERYFAVKQGDTTYVTDGVTIWGSRYQLTVLFAKIVDIGGCGTPGYDEGSFYPKSSLGLDRMAWRPDPNNENVEDLGEHISLDAAARHWYG
tara:strand:+ start:137 stop:415 length:279 start_codon:yes stop_codon:yes gene_type:complete